MRPGFTDKDGVPEALNDTIFLNSVEATLERFDETALAVRLQIANADTWNRYDQLVTEAHFRASMALPTALISVALSVRVTQLLVLGVLGSVGLRYSGLGRLKAARGVLVQALTTSTSQTRRSLEHMLVRLSPWSKRSRTWRRNSSSSTSK